MQSVNKTCIKLIQISASTRSIKCVVWGIKWWSMQCNWPDLHHFQSYSLRFAVRSLEEPPVLQQYPTFHLILLLQLPHLTYSCQVLIWIRNRIVNISRIQSNALYKYFNSLPQERRTFSCSFSWACLYSSCNSFWRMLNSPSRFL